MIEPEQEKNISEMFQFLHLSLHFLAFTAPLTIFKVHRCGTSGSMRACHAAGLGSFPGWDKFPG